MPELRLNPISREWIIIESNMTVTPHDFIGRRECKELPDRMDSCHFCKGNEHAVPEEVYRIDNGRDWSVRVIRNMFSRLSVEGDKQRWGSALHKTASAVGVHEIIVETPRHDLTTAHMSEDQLKDVLRCYRDRFIEVHKDKRVEHVVIFKNSGPSSGTSFEHSLSQIVGVPVMPLAVRDRLESYLKYYDETGECLMCGMIREELLKAERIIDETEHFVSFVPYAAMSPFHTWIFPKRHSGSFAEITSEESGDLAAILKTTLLRIHHGLDNADFNYAVRSEGPANADSKFFHWYVSIVPRLGYMSGFEIACGMFVNPLRPELSAKYMREVRLPER